MKNSRPVWLALRLLFVGSVLFSVPGQAAGSTTPTFVQEADNQVNSGKTSAVTLSSPTVAGNLIVAYLIWDNTGTASVSDSLGNIYASAGGPTRWSNGSYSTQIFYTINLRSGVDTVTATFGTAVNSFGIVYAHEYSGVRQTSPLDVTVAAAGAAGSLASGSATTTNAEDLLFAGGVSANFVTSPGPGYTARSTSHGNMTEDRVVSATGSYNATASNSSGAWAIQMVAFKGLSTSSGSPTVSITSPANNQTISGTTTVTAYAADNVGVVGVQFHLDGGNLGAEVTTSPYATSWSTSQTTNGSHLLTAIARDAAGNKTTSSAVTVIVNNASTKPYTTSFPLTENPISEGAHWINGNTTGLDWSNVQTTPGLAFGAAISTNTPYNDPTAVLSGTWSSNQKAQAIVRTVNQNSSIFEEVELRLRTTINAHSITGYEFNFRCTSDGTQYAQIVRWNGPLGNFTLLGGMVGPGLHNGDVVTATAVGSTLTSFINGVQIVQVTDSTYAGGSPGMGFYNQGGILANNSDFGFTNYTATDNLTGDALPPSTPANLAANEVSSSQINLTWNASTDNVAVVGYHVYRNSNQLATTATTSFSDTTVIPGVQYTYTVSAFDAAGNTSAQSSSVLAETSPVADLTPPSVPTNLKSSNVTSTTLTLTWSASTDNVAVAGYRIFRNGTQVGTTGTPSYTDTGLVASTTYTYTVAAYDTSKNLSAQSPGLMVTTTSAAVISPSIVQVNNDQVSTGTTVSAALNAPTQAGNTIVVYVIWNNTGSVALTDSRGDSFVTLGAALSWGNGYSAQIFYAPKIAGGTDTVTATFRTSVTAFGVLYVHEYAGISPTNAVDVSASASGSSATLNSGTAITTSANDLIFGAGVSDNTVTAAGSGFLSRDMAYGNITEDRIATSIGSYAATATHNGQMWGMQMVAFRPAQ